MTDWIRNNKKRILRIYLVLVIGFIWGQSLLPAQRSSEESSRVLEEVVHPVEKALTGRETITEHQVRKTAHVLEYTALGFGLILYAFCLYEERKSCCREKCPSDLGQLPELSRVLKIAPRVLLTGMFIAFLDETIQVFTGRGPMIQDVWIDTGGIVLGGMIALICMQAGRWFAGGTSQEQKNMV